MWDLTNIAYSAVEAINNMTDVTPASFLKFVVIDSILTPTSNPEWKYVNYARIYLKAMLSDPKWHIIKSYEWMNS